MAKFTSVQGANGMVKIITATLTLVMLVGVSPVSGQGLCERLPILSLVENQNVNAALLRSGYCVYDGNAYYYSPGIPTWEFHDQPGPVHYQTRALYYNDDLMQLQGETRGINLSDVAGGVSFMSSSLVGATGWIRSETSDWVKVRSADSVNSLHAYFHIVTLGSGIEITFALGEMIGITHPGGGTVEVCVTDGDPHIVCRGHPVDYTEWWLDNVDYQ